MKIKLFFFLALLFLSSSLFAQWINGLKPNCSNMATTCKKTATQSGFWDDPDIWSPTGVPTGSAADNVVCIPAGITVQLKNPQYPNNPVSSRPTLYIFVCGTIEFISSGKLYLSTASTVNIMPSTGRLIGNNASTIIEIGNCADPTLCEWQGPSTINAPYYLSGTGKGAGVLAASLKDFRANLKGPFEVSLEWTTISEENSYEFTVERSTDAKSWTAISTLLSSGNSNSQINYSTIDKKPAQGISYYRLKEIDINGKFEYSSIAKITNRTTGKIAVYPNPARNQATIYSATSFNSSQSIQLFNITGALVKTIGVRAGNTISLPLEDIGAGVYLVRVTENGTTLSETKLIKQ